MVMLLSIISQTMSHKDDGIETSGISNTLWNIAVERTYKWRFIAKAG